MKKTLKFVATLMGAIVAGGVIGWTFGKFGISTAVGVGCIAAVASAVSAEHKKIVKVEDTIRA